MEKICKGIQHIVVVKGLDRYVTELSQWWKYIYTNARGEKTEYRCGFTSDNESVSPAEFSYEKDGDEWVPLTPLSLDDETATSTDSARTIAPVTAVVEYDAYYESSFPFNPCAVKWTPYIKKEEGDEREYRCVLKNEDSDTFKVEDVDSSYVIGDNEEYYVSFKFSPSDTGDLKVGKVSMSVIDSDNTLIYYKKHYAKVFETILDEEET